MLSKCRVRVCRPFPPTKHRYTSRGGPAKQDPRSTYSCNTQRAPSSFLCKLRAAIASSFFSTFGLTLPPIFHSFPNITRPPSRFFFFFLRAHCDRAHTCENNDWLLLFRRPRDTHVVRRRGNLARRVVVVRTACSRTIRCRWRG